MKFLYFFLMAFLLVLCVQCATRNKITYNIPPSYSKEQKEMLVKELDKGKALYKLYCTKCHGIFTKGDDKTPNFTNKQIDNYSARFMRRDPRNHAVAIKMDYLQLNEVMQFLKYKRATE